ncbi:MAG: hypothetical protein ACLRWQ_12030 [Flavonifractor plautii]
MVHCNGRVADQTVYSLPRNGGASERRRQRVGEGFYPYLIGKD